VEDVVIDLTKPGVLAITPKVKEHFKTLLQQQQVELRFTYGHWGGMARDFDQNGAQEKGYDLVLTSETIYSEDSVDDLVAVLRAASPSQVKGEEERSSGKRIGKVEVGLEESLGDLKLGNWRKGLLREQEGVILVAAKVRSVNWLYQAIAQSLRGAATCST
jgi:protein-histidine N-methyltransferase